MVVRLYDIRPKTGNNQGNFLLRKKALPLFQLESEQIEVRGGPPF